jgi:hypothetical protein
MDTRGKGVVESMRHVRMLGLCLVAVFAFGAIVASGASAFKPEWGTCTAQEHGKYLDAGCMEKAHGKGPKGEKVYEGSYEWAPTSFSTKRRGTSGSISFETQAGEKIECPTARSGDSMSFTPQGAGTPNWEFEGCEGKGEQCSTASLGSPEGIVINALAFLGIGGASWNGTLGYIEGGGGPNPVVGVSFRSENTGFESPEGETIAPGTPERFFAPIACSNEEPGPEAIGTVWIGGERHGGNSVIGALAPVNQMSESYTLTYSESSPGIQAPEKFEHKKRDVLEAFLHNRWEPVAWTGEFKLAVPVGSPKELRATR